MGLQDHLRLLDILPFTLTDWTAYGLCVFPLTALLRSSSLSSIQRPGKT